MPIRLKTNRSAKADRLSNWVLSLNTALNKPLAHVLYALAAIKIIANWDLIGI